MAGSVDGRFLSGIAYNRRGLEGQSVKLSFFRSSLLMLTHVLCVRVCGVPGNLGQRNHLHEMCNPTPAGWTEYVYAGPAENGVGEEVLMRGKMRRTELAEKYFESVIRGRIRGKGEVGLRMS